MEQLVARWAHNPKAVGSSPAPATLKALTKMSGLFYFHSPTLFPISSKKKKLLQFSLKQLMKEKTIEL